MGGFSFKGGKSGEYSDRWKFKAKKNGKSQHKRICSPLYGNEFQGGKLQYDEF